MRAALSVCLVASFVLPAVAQVRVPAAASLEVAVPYAPIPFRADGKLHLVYELHITNFRSVEVALTRIELLNVEKPGSKLPAYEDALLRDGLGRPGMLPDPASDPRVLAGGMRAVFFVWIAVDQKDVPKRLRHRVTFNVAGAGGSEAGSVDGAALAVRSDTPVPLGPPLKGGLWVASYGPSNQAAHRRTIVALEGKPRIPQRFGIDFVRLNDGALAVGDRNVVANWSGYGAEVLAVADATVVQVRDGVAEPVLLNEAPRPMPLAEAGGNSITLDLGGGRYAFYGHLKTGSIKVKTGEHVEAGDVIGLLGHSGNSTGPHLHFHVSDARSTLAAEGLPYAFGRFDVVGRVESSEALERDGVWKETLAKPVRRTLEMPLESMVIRFP